MESLDLRGLDCPIPLLRAKKYIEQMSAGQTVMMKSTEDKFGKDIRDLCNHLGVSIVSVHWKAGVVTAIIAK